MTQLPASETTTAPPAPSAGRWSRALSWLLPAFRLGLAVTFTWSAVHHLQDPIAFILKVNEYEVLPAALVEPFALAMPWAMLVSSALLVLGLLTRAAAGTQGLMLLSFIVAVGINIFRDRVMGCGCFSEEGSQIGWPLVLQDLGLLLLAVMLVVKGGGRWTLDTLLLSIYYQKNSNKMGGNG